MSDTRNDIEPENQDLLEDQEEKAQLPDIYKNKFGTIIPTSMVAEMEKSYLDYAMSVIVSRALPDVRDGLKPVHRRILFAMKGLGLSHNASYKKSARIVGEVLGKFHPHGDTAVYDALVRLAQDFSIRYPLIDGQGNFGSVDGDSPAAMRYTEAKMQSITEELLVDIEKDTVSFVDNFDGSTQEPTVLPAKLPNLLLMGADGIAVGMATKIPPHNLTEVCKATMALIDKGRAIPHVSDKKEDYTEEFLEKCDAKILAGSFESDASIDDLLEHIQGPDFPTGGIMYDWNAIKETYIGGKGRIVTRAVAEIEEGKSGRHKIIITELPYQVNKAKLVSKIADLVKNKKIVGISDLRDESDREGMRVVVMLKRDARPKSVLNNLYKYTQLQESFSANMVALTADGAPQLMNLKTILSQYVGHRQLVVVRRAQYELRSARARAHILEGLLIALDHLDEVISIIRNSPDAEVAKGRLMTQFKLSDIQATAILDMQLRKLAALERKKIEEEYKAIMEKIKELVTLITNPTSILNVISEEMKQIIDKYGDKRRTKLVKAKIGEINETDLIASEENIIAVSESGYIKRMSLSQYRSQRRGGQGVTGMATKEEDTLAKIMTVNTHDSLIIFTNQGKAYKLNVYELPETSRQAKGQAIINFIGISQNETIKAIVSIAKDEKELKNKYILLVTKNGMIKKTKLDQYTNIRSNGIIAMNLSDDDELVFGNITDGTHHVMLVSSQGKGIRFPETDTRPMARDTRGVKGMNLKPNDFIVSADSFPSDLLKQVKEDKKFFLDIVIISERGIGKRTNVDNFPLQKRAGQGVIAFKTDKKTGSIACAKMVTPADKAIVVTSTKAQVIKFSLQNIPTLRRATKGVILMRMSSAEDKVSGVANLGSDDPEEEDLTEGA